MSSLNDFQR